MVQPYPYQSVQVKIVFNLEWKYKSSTTPQRINPFHKQRAITTAAAHIPHATLFITNKHEFFSFINKPTFNYKGSDLPSRTSPITAWVNNYSIESCRLSPILTKLAIIKRNYLGRGRTDQQYFLGTKVLYDLLKILIVWSKVRNHQSRLLSNYRDSQYCW